MDAVFGRLRSIVAAPETRTEKARRAAEAIRDARAYHWVGLYDVTSSEIVVFAWTGAEAPAFPRFPADRGLNGAAVRSGQPVVVQDVRADSRYLTTFGSTRAEAIFPIQSPVTGKVLGTLDAESDRAEAFTSQERSFLASCSEILLPLWFP
jgi:GAF domain-containing protein